jgi:hypothetical protein
MEVFVEQDVIAEMRIPLELLVVAKDRAAPVGVSQEDPGEPGGKFIGHLGEREISP